MAFTLDNRTQTFVQVAVSTILFVVMLIVWRTQKTYPGFGRWTVAKLPNVVGWLLISLRGSIPDWISVVLGNGLLLLSITLLYEGLRQFRGKHYRDVFNYLLMVFLVGGFIYFTRVQPNVNLRIALISVCGMIIFARAAFDLSFGAPRNLRSSYWFTTTMFAVYAFILFLRVITTSSQPSLSNPFDVDIWQNLLFLATNVVGIGWTFGFFMMTNHRLDLELRAAEDNLREMAMTDFLTGVFNRRAFTEMAEREVERAARYEQGLAFLIVDIDHFKNFNDEHGHIGGDIMLREMVAILRANLRAVDVLARWGGEEFAILLPETDRSGCLQVAEKLRAAVNDLSIPVDQKLLKTTISVGCALWKKGDESLDAVLGRADVALYQAKQSGRNCVALI